MAKIGAKELASRAMRERNYELAQKAAKTSRGNPKIAPYRPAERAGDGNGFRTKGKAKSSPAARRSPSVDGSLAPDVRDDTTQGSRPAVSGPRETLPTGTKPKRGRPRIGEKAAKPWIAAGMTKSTWYRRQAEAKKNG